MPTYSYRCEQCDSSEDHVQKMSDPPMQTCSACGGQLRKQMTAPAFSVKGYSAKSGYAKAKPQQEGFWMDKPSAGTRVG